MRRLSRLHTPSPLLSRHAPRPQDACALVREARLAGRPVPEHWAFLLRERCKELGVRHADVPDHPLAWQFSPRVLRMRRAKGKTLNKVAQHGLRHKMSGIRVGPQRA